MKIFLDVDPLTNKVRGWGSTPVNNNPIEIEIEENHPFLSDNPFIYVYSSGQLKRDDLFILEKAKEDKDVELNKACKQAILGGFNHVIDGIEYHFSYDYEAQGNFRDAKEVLKDGLVETIDWTVQKDGQYMRIPIDLATLNQLQVTILHHKGSNISKYRDYLMPIVSEAEDLNEVGRVVW